MPTKFRAEPGQVITHGGPDGTRTLTADAAGLIVAADRHDEEILTGFGLRPATRQSKPAPPDEAPTQEPGTPAQEAV